MPSLTTIKIVIVTAFIVIYASIYTFGKFDLEQRVQDVGYQQVEQLSNNYNIIQGQLKIIADNTYNTVINDPVVLEAFSAAKHTDNEAVRSRLRQKVYNKIKPHFDRLQELGVIITLFSFENNQTFLRVHKPDKFNDDLSKVRYSFTYVNANKKITRGLEQGKISHALRNIYPLYYKDEFLGSVDIAFSTDTLEESMTSLYNRDTHFILNKSVFASKIWEAQKRLKYIQSIEHKDFLFSLGGYRKDYTFDDAEVNFNKKFKDEIAKNIKDGKSFFMDDKSYLVAYLPIKNIKDKKTIAYLVSYEHSIYIERILNEFLIMKIVAFIMLMILAFIVYNNIKQRVFLQQEVDKKTEDLKYLNENLEVEVAKQNKAFETLFERSPYGILIIENQKFVQCNEAITKMLRYNSKEELLNKHPSELSPEFQPDGSTSLDKANLMMKKAIDDGANDFEWMHVKADGEEFWANVTLTPISLADRDVIYVTWRDISMQKHMQAELMDQKMEFHHRAHHDSLTNLPNRELFHDRLAQSIEVSKRQNKKFAVLFIDLDRFKQINDSLGHLVGDQVLIEISNRFATVIRSEDTLARLGGDEFTIIMQDIHKGEEASLLAEKIIKAASKPICINEHSLYVTTSIGISLYPDDGLTSEDLLMYADNAMYKAKEEGRNNYQFYSSDMTVLALGKVVMESSIRNALDEEEFVVYYQPQVNGLTGEVVGIEALVRWEHPTMGLTSPYKFIPIAEETGLMIQIDNFVMKTAMMQVSKWYKEGLFSGVLALNLTMKLLERKDFLDIVKSLLEETQINTKWLEFEVTESQIMKNPEDAISKLLEIGKMDVNIAIDDFGIGYSSLSHLKQLPIDKLKIDKSFILDIPDDEDDMSIVIAIVSLAKSLNINVLAEGVETQEQKDFLVKHECFDIQGYFYSKPAPADEFEKFLFDHKPQKSKDTWVI